MRLFRRSPKSEDPRPNVKKAQRDLDATRAKTPAYLALAERLRDIRERNHFAAAFQKSVKGGRYE